MSQLLICEIYNCMLFSIDISLNLLLKLKINGKHTGIENCIHV